MPSRPAQLRPVTKHEPNDDFTKAIGRPVRKLAGCKSLPAGYLNPDDAGIEHGSDSSDSEQEPLRKSWKQKAFPRVEPLSPTHPADFDTPSRETSPEQHESNCTTWKPVPESVSLTFNVPKDHNGPFVVNLSLKDLLPIASTSQSSRVGFRSAILKSVGSSAREGRHSHATGFIDLPPEIRSIVYRQLAIASRDLTFAAPEFCLSGQFLRTCKLVYVEMAPVLYGNNTFIFPRDHNSSGNYWKKPWTEVGYKNIRRWLTDIGPDNISLLRDVELSLSDGPPSACYHRADPIAKEDARFVHDGHIIACLRMLAKYGQLRTLRLNCSSRKILSAHDDRFISELKKVKVDSLEDHSLRTATYSYGFRVRSKVDADVFHYLRNKMERKPRLYLSKPARDEG